MPPPRAQGARSLGWAAAAGVFCAGAVLVAPAALLPHPACPVPALTGLHCPGCGGLRCAAALARGDLGAALGANALVVAAGAVLALFLALRLMSALLRRPPPAPPPRAVAWGLGGAALAFTVLRNLPIGAVLAP
ncbi:DUF2752 domain-containing protein [Streptomyces hainanensis]|uniref:DUF2752 domain-containing protein n=1 Tax=Streptomyces hainanensis TaxID=402648 RepID=UPI001FB730E6|nr:DUF2752 domain-containing protein [Streptomyces hainanensis]